MKLFKSILSGCVMVGLLAIPAMASGGVEYKADGVYISAEPEIITRCDMTLNPLVLNGVYYNYEYNYSFRIPPLWEDKVDILERSSADGVVTEFIYNDPEGKREVIGSISAVPSGRYLKKAGDYCMARTEAFVYVFNTEYLSPYDGTQDEELEKVKAVFNGIDDLFNIVAVRSEISKAISDNCQYKVRLDSERGVEITIYKNSEGSIMVPLREVAQELRYEVLWNNDLSEATVIGNERNVKVTVGKYVARSTDSDIVMEAVPTVVNSRMYVSLDFLYEALL